MISRFGQFNGPFWTIFLEIKIFWGRFGDGPFWCSPLSESSGLNPISYRRYVMVGVIPSQTSSSSIMRPVVASEMLLTCCVLMKGVLNK